MASVTATELVAKMGLDTSPFEKGLARAQSSFASTVQNISNLVSGPLTAAFGAIASGAALSTYLREADQFGKLSESLGMDVQALQEWSGAAEMAGGSAQGFQSTVKNLSDRLQMVTNGTGGELQKVFDGIGISAKNSNGKVKDVLEVMEDLAGKAETMDKQKFVSFAKKMGIDDGTIMLLQSGKTALKDLIKEQKELGAYTAEDIELAKETNDAITKLQKRLKMGANEIIRLIIPAIKFLIAKLDEGVRFVRKHQPFFITAVTAIATAITVSMIPALSRMAVAAWRAVAPFAPFIAAGLLLAAVIDDLIVYMHGGESALEGFWQIFGTGPEIAEKLKNAWEKLKEVGTKVFDALSALFKNVIKQFSGVVEPLKNEYMELGRFFNDLFEGNFDSAGEHLYNALSSAIESCFAIFQGLGNIAINIIDGVLQIIFAMFSENGDQIYADFKSTFSEVVESIKDFFSECIKWISDKFKNLFSGLLDDVGNLIKKIPGVESVTKGISDGIDRGTKKFKELTSGLFTWSDDKKDNTDGTPVTSTPIAPLSGQASASASVPSSVIQDNKQVDQSKHDTRIETNITVNANGVDSDAIGQATQRGAEKALSKFADTGVK